jgi:glycerophosphoryl diester phosphodiesterase
MMLMKKIIAHRGAPSLAHENTIESFFRAYQAGADFIEFDVRRTRDKILVAHHDPCIVSNSEKIKIGDLTYNELTNIASEHNFEIPEIKQILQAFSGKVGLDIELKEEDCEQEILKMISDLPVKPCYFFTSFNPAILRKLKKTDSSLQTGLLFESMDSINEDSKGIDFLCPDYDTFFSNRDYFASTAKQFSAAVWTVDTPEKIGRVLKDPLVWAVITNQTVLAVSIRNEFYGRNETT